MTANDLSLLKDVLGQDKAERFPQYTNSAYFEIFVTEQLLKNHELSDDEVDAGITGGGNDGGIDSMFTFVNGQLLFEDTDLTAYKKSVVIDVYIMQAKQTEGFEGAALDKIIATLKDILELNTRLATLKNFYDAKLLEAVDSFRRAYQKLASRFPNVNLMITYATCGDTDQIHPNVTRKAEIIKAEVKNLLRDCETSFVFYGAKELLRLARQKPSTTIIVDVPYYLDLLNQEAYLCLINLKTYYEFITDDKMQLRKHLFEANVRDYQGKIEVNEGIRKTLKELKESEEDFWWLNNGITIIAAKATLAGKRKITLEDPQIVNGLQTSTEIFEYFRANPEVQDSEKRSLLVKIIVTTSPSSQENIIRATNSQTSVPLASLKATDKVQRDIEDHFRHNGFYYDRRKNFYKNQKVQRDKIISIPYLAQAIMALVLQEPDQARARPSSLLKKDSDYKKVFHDLYPLGLYLNCVKILRSTDQYVKSDKILAEIDEKNNLKFHFAMYLTLSIIGYRSNKREIIIKNIANIDINSINSDSLDDTWNKVVILFRNYRAVHPKTSPDSIGKSKEFVAYLLKHLADEQQKNIHEINPR